MGSIPLCLHISARCRLLREPARETSEHRVLLVTLSHSHIALASLKDVVAGPPHSLGPSPPRLPLRSRMGAAALHRTGSGTNARYASRQCISKGESTAVTARTNEASLVSLVYVLRGWFAHSAPSLCGHSQAARGRKCFELCFSLSSCLMILTPYYLTNLTRRACAHRTYCRSMRHVRENHHGDQGPEAEQQIGVPGGFLLRAIG